VAEGDRRDHPDISEGAGALNLGINATFLNDQPTGIGVYTREVSTRLCSLNRDTCVFTSVPLLPLPWASIKKTPVFIRGSSQFVHNLGRFIYSNTLLPILLKRYEIDLLYCPLMEFPFLSPVPLVVTVFDLHPIYFPRQFGYAARFFQFSLRRLPVSARRVIVPSQYVKTELLKAIPIESDCIDVIPLSYDSALFKPQDCEANGEFLEKYGIKKPFILFVGSLFPYKNIKTLVAAFSAIKSSIPHSLVIIGKKEVSPEPPQEDERIHYLDYIQREDIPRFYSSADVLVHPSLTEGFGMTVLEAMACGTPVISSRGGSLPEVVGDAGVLFEPEDSASLSEKMLMVIHNEGLRSDMIRKGFEQVKKFSWEKTAEGILLSCEKALTEMK
jgi:glycosyltransferase involved in cell wall biosynthesis